MPTSLQKRRKATICYNCDTTLLNAENYCPNCGQENHSKQASIRQLFDDFLGDYLAFDSRLFRSVFPLISQPGRITIDYLDGKRQRFIPPIRVFLFLSFLYFGLSFFIGQDSTAIQFTAEESEKGAQAVKDGLQNNFNLLLFFYTPLFALILRPFFKSEKRNFYVNFFVYALHLFSLFFIIATIQISIYALFRSIFSEDVSIIARMIVQSITLLYVVYYVYVSLKRVFEKKHTLLRLLAVFVISVIAFLSLITVAVMLLFAIVH